MKILSDSKERTFYLVKEWETKAGLKAMVNKCVWKDRVKELAPSLNDYYTGYVQVPPEAKFNEDSLDVHGGVTFHSPIQGFDGMWIGFDMNHYGDENIQSEEYAEEECEKLAKQIK